MNNIIQTYTDKGKRNALFLVFMFFFFPIVALTNYCLELKTGIVSHAYRGVNLLICFVLIYEFLKEKRYKSILSNFKNFNFFSTQIAYLLFVIFFIFYFIRLYLDIEVYRIHEITVLSRSYLYLFSVGITIIPMFSVATINKIDFDYFNKKLLLLLKIIGVLLFINFFADKYINRDAVYVYRYIVSKEGFDYFDAISIAVYGGLLIIMTLLNNDNNFLKYIYTGIGAFLVVSTASRGPIVAILITILFVIIFKEKKITVKYLYFIISVAIAVGINFLVSQMMEKYYKFGNPLLHRIQNFTEDQSTISRSKLIRESISQFMEKPFFGSHFFVIESKMYAHNFILDVLISTGIFGLLLIIPGIFLFSKKLLISFPVISFCVLGLYFFLNAQLSGAIYNLAELWAFFSIIILYPTEQLNKTAL